MNSSTGRSAATPAWLSSSRSSI